jgi:hypothetical protein
VWLAALNAGYLNLRYGRATSGLSAISFALMTILMSGVNMYAMAIIMKVVLGWNIHFSIWISSLTVGIYVASGGLFSAIFNEVVQFFLIWFGALLIPVLGLIETGGWSGMVARIQANFPGKDFTHAWSTLGDFTANPMGMHWTGIVFGLGSVISMGYWTTDFLVVQRVLACPGAFPANVFVLAHYGAGALPLRCGNAELSPASRDGFLTKLGMDRAWTMLASRRERRGPGSRGGAEGMVRAGLA